MESERVLLLVGLMLVSIFLYQEWQVMYGPQPIQPVPTQTATTSGSIPTSADVPADSSAMVADVPSERAEHYKNIVIRRSRFCFYTTATQGILKFVGKRNRCKV